MPKSILVVTDVLAVSAFREGTSAAESQEDSPDRNLRWGGPQYGEAKSLDSLSLGPVPIEELILSITAEKATSMLALRSLVQTLRLLLAIDHISCRCFSCSHVRMTV